MIGDPKFLSFDLEWDDLSDDQSAEGRSWAKLRVWIEGEPAWLKGPGIRWTMTDLLAHLAWNWPWLLWQEGLPHGETANLARVARDQVLPPDDLTADELDNWQDAWWSFSQVHDLSNALQGVFVPSFWLVRRGLEFELATTAERWLLPEEPVVSALEALCSAISDRIRPAADATARSLTAKWAERQRVPLGQQERLLTGLSASYLEELEPVADTRMALLGIGPWPQPSPYCAVARMAGPVVDPAMLRQILSRVAELGMVDKTALDHLTAAVSVPMELARRPHETGMLLARRARAALGLGADKDADPAAILAQLGIPVLELRQEGHVDAVAVWSQDHGPAILLNYTSRRNKGALHAQRATLAHELCHLVTDRLRALPLGEVLGGAVCAEVEACANAFAAEFLLPQETAAVLARTKHSGELIEFLCGAFRVGAELAAWQVINSTAWAALPRADRAAIVQFIPDLRRRRQLLDG